MFDFNSERIVGEKEHLANDAQKAILAILHHLIQKMDHPGEKACMLAGCAIPAIAGIGILFGNHPEPVLNPSPDDVMFGAIYTVCNIEQHPQGLVAGFSMDGVKKACQMFQDLTGRKYDLAPVLVEVLADMDQQISNDVPENVVKFIKN